MSNPDIFTLDLGEKYLKIADIEKRKDKYLIKSAAISPLNSPTNVYSSDANVILEKTADQLQSLIKDSGIKKKNVYIIIPDSRSYSQVVEMPLLTEKELISAIKYQADQFIPLPIEKLSLDLEILDEDKTNRRLKILLVAAENAILNKVTLLAEMCGLIPEKIENETSAVLRFVSEALPQEQNNQGLSLFINFGYCSTSLYVFDSLSGLPLTVYNFNLGYNIFIKDMTINYNLSQEQAEQLLETTGFSDATTDKTSFPSAANLWTILSAPYNEFINELEKFIISLKNKTNSSITDIFIFGEGHKINSFEKKISDSLATPVKILDIAPFLIKNNTVDFLKNDLPLLVPLLGTNI
jgi:type IV pilus assembly protein PilM